MCVRKLCFLSPEKGIIAPTSTYWVGLSWVLESSLDGIWSKHGDAGNASTTTSSTASTSTSSTARHVVCGCKLRLMKDFEECRMLMVQER